MVWFRRKKHHEKKENKSKLYFATLLLEGIQNISAQKIRSIFTMAGIVFGIATFIIISGVNQTANGQIAKNFDELQDTHITIFDISASKADEHEYNFPANASEIIEKLNGVLQAGTYFKITDDNSEEGGMYISTLPAVSAGEDFENSITAFAATGETLKAMGVSVKKGGLINSLHDEKKMPVVVAGSVAAQKLGLTKITSDQAIFIKNNGYNVIGVLDDAPKAYSWVNSAIFIPTQTAIRDFGKPDNTNAATMIIHTKLGAGKLLSVQAPYALNPNNPALLQGNSPPDWSKLSEGASKSLDSLMLIMSIISLVIGGVAITNVALVSVIQRRGEIGLRRALGAKKIHIYLQILIESSFVGFVGATIGNTIGIFGIITISFFQGWTPIIQHHILLLAPLFGIIIGSLAGIYPAYRAIKINPSQALISL